LQPVDLVNETLHLISHFILALVGWCRLASLPLIIDVITSAGIIPVVLKGISQTCLSVFKMDPIDIAARALANMDESLYEIDEEMTATYNTDDNSAKRIKRESMPKVPKAKPIQPPPSSLIVSFKNQEGIPSRFRIQQYFLLTG
jgi:hypothetical protein